VLFDCDGVLVDSETLTNGALRDMLAERGWPMSSSECMLQFVGKAVSDEAALIEQKTGMPVTEDWLASFRQRRNKALQAEVRAIPTWRTRCTASMPGTAAALPALGCRPLQGGADAGQARLLALFRTARLQRHEMPRSEPHPDVYLPPPPPRWPHRPRAARWWRTP